MSTIRAMITLSVWKLTRSASQPIWFLTLKASTSLTSARDGQAT